MHFSTNQRDNSRLPLLQTAALVYNFQKSLHTVVVVAAAFAVAEFEQFEGVEGSFAAVVVGQAGDSAAEADKSVVLEPFAVLEPEPFAGLELLPVPELVSVSTFDIVAVHRFAAVECRSVVAGCSLDCQKWFEVDVRQQSL